MTRDRRQARRISKPEAGKPTTHEGQPVSGPQPSVARDEVFSRRLLGLMEDVLEGKAPNAGRFCGDCYHPLPSGKQPAGDGADRCPHCGRGTDTRPSVARVPDEVFAMYRAQRSREGLMVRGIAWSGFTLGVVLALLPPAIYGVTWWTALAFFAATAVFYIGSANLANSLGDALGYRWGQSELRRRWEAFVRQREGG